MTTLIIVISLVGATASITGAVLITLHVTRPGRQRRRIVRQVVRSAQWTPPAQLPVGDPRRAAVIAPTSNGHGSAR